MSNDATDTKRRSQPLAPLYHDLLVHLATPDADGRLPTLEVRSGKFVTIYPFAALTREGKWAAEHVVRDGLVSRLTSSHDLWQINDAGRAELVKPRPEWQTLPPRPLTREDLEILRDAVRFNRVAPKSWFSPKDIGGQDSSRHSRVLRKLVHHSLMECRENRAGDDDAVIGDPSVVHPTLFKLGGKPNRVYRVTTKTVWTFDKLWEQLSQKLPDATQQSEDAS